MPLLNLQTRFTVVAEDGTAQVLVPAHHLARIGASASVLRRRVPPGSVAGLLYRSEPALILAWLACLSAGLKPLILQYPTRKQTRTYWQDSIQNTVGEVGIAAIVADEYCASLAGDRMACLLIAQRELESAPDADVTGIGAVPDDFCIVQLSSGTTGYRKAVEFTHDQLARHVEDYSRALDVTPSDRIASWLPLYHDMGYVACFVMPLMLGIDVVMIDPMTWVQSPSMLFDAIEQHRCTLCYMPNFGFEVMARSQARPMPGMRRWVSCSEPVSARTSARFLAAIDAPDHLLSPCYAMAENVFAVTIAKGCRTRTIDGAEVVSCGPAIPGVDLKTVDGEVWVRSRSSITGYLGGGDVRDPDGFYATGDLGQVIDGELFVCGRKQDLLVQAGRKYLLSDIDLRLNELFPQVRGRAAALALRDERLGTEMPIVLIEAPDFFERSDKDDIASALKGATGLDQMEVAFVPPRFITKTSSGKINRRRTAADWLAVQSAREQARSSGRGPREELAQSFAALDWDRPVHDVLDSLAQTVLRIILDATPIVFDGTKSLREIDAALAARIGVPSQPRREAKGLRIVSLANRTTIRRITERHLQRLERRFGCPVSLEHVCLPPSAVMLSDVIFHDYFRPRLDSPAFDAVDRVMEKLKGASIILVDDMAEMFWRYDSTYTVLSHNLQRDPLADLVSFRWPQYVQNHDQLPLTIMAGNDVPLSATSSILGRLQTYLATPIFRIGVIEEFSEYTSDWELHAFGAHDVQGVNGAELVTALIRWVENMPTRPVRRPLRQGARLALNDPRHFCSHKVVSSVIDQVIDRFDRFCISGSKASLPYVQQRLQALGKSFVRVPSHSPEMLEPLRQDFDCLLICGAVGRVDPSLPAAAFQFAELGWRVQNLGAWAEMLPPMNDVPASGTDWFHAVPLSRDVDRSVWERARSQRRRRILAGPGRQPVSADSA